LGALLELQPFTAAQLLRAYDPEGTRRVTALNRASNSRDENVFGR
jgi:hypothetical protein